MNVIDDAILAQIECEHGQGLTSAQILQVFASHEIPFSEATLRKYVQLGLLPRSVRVGRKGKHQGSQGLYPVGVVRQILRIKQMMAARYTIEQIQREVLFIRSDLEQLERAIEAIFSKLLRAIEERRSDDRTRLVARKMKEARSAGNDFLTQVTALETRLTSQTGLTQAVAS